MKVWFLSADPRRTYWIRRIRTGAYAAELSQIVHHQKKAWGMTGDGGVVTLRITQRDALYPERCVIPQARRHARFGIVQAKKKI